MAVTEKERVIRMTADGDSVDRKLIIQAIHVDGAVADIQDGNGNPIIDFANEGSIHFPTSLFMTGVQRGAGSGTLFLYLSV